MCCHNADLMKSITFVGLKFHIGLKKNFNQKTYQSSFIFSEVK